VANVIDDRSHLIFQSFFTSDGAVRSMVIQYKTPGVYVTELDAFPPALVGVQTAVPAFIGYTEKAVANGQSVELTPVKITSLADYKAVFGASYEPIYNLAKADTENPPDVNFGGVPYSLVPADNKSFNLYNSLRLFYANGGGDCYIVSVGSFKTEGSVVELTHLAAGLEIIKGQVGPTILAIPEATLLPDQTAFNTLAQAMIAQSGAMQDRVALLDVWGTQTLNQKSPTFQDDFGTLIGAFREGVGTNFLSYGMAYFPFLTTSIVQSNELDLTSYNLETTNLALLQAALTAQVDMTYPSDSARNKALKDQINAISAKPAAPVGAADMPAYEVAVSEWRKSMAAINQDLVAGIAELGTSYKAMASKLNVLPPSSAMAGIYTHVDTNRGVWNAPANMSMSSVIGPTIKLTSSMQEDLNVPLDGKAINAIRDFVGRGTLVWGARTLDGNSNDWRYIQVRRTFIHIEQSIKQALDKFVFASNDSQTWTTVTSMITNFLQTLWSQGGLMGSMPSESFKVRCGLGSTMTAQDVLNGYMIVQITLQMIRPAEFIELTLKQKMQGAG